MRPHKQSYLNRGESLIHSSKSTVILAFFFSCIPTSICQCHCPRRDVAWTVYPMNGIPWRAAARRSSPDGTVAQNANPVRGGKNTTILVPREQRGVAATWRMKEKRRAPTSYNPLHHLSSLQGGSTIARAAATFQQKSKYITHLLIKQIINMGSLLLSLRSDFFYTKYMINRNYLLLWKCRYTMIFPWFFPAISRVVFSFNGDTKLIFCRLCFKMLHRV